MLSSLKNSKIDHYIKNNLLLSLLILFIISLLFKLPFFDIYHAPWWDGTYQVEIVKNWFEGKGYNLENFGGEGSYHAVRVSPLFGFFTVATSKIFNLHLHTSGKLVSLFSYSFLVIFTFLLSYKFFGFRVSIITIVLLSISPHLTSVSVNATDYCLTTILTISFVYFMFIAREKEKSIFFVIPGMLCALAYLNRAELIGLLPIGVFYFFIPIKEGERVFSHRKIYQFVVFFIVFLIIASPRIVLLAQLDVFVADWGRGTKQIGVGGTEHIFWGIGAKLMTNIKVLISKHYGHFIFTILPWFVSIFMGRYDRKQFVKLLWLAIPFWVILSFRLLTVVHWKYLTMIAPLGYIIFGYSIIAVFQWYVDFGKRIELSKIMKPVGKMLFLTIIILLFSYQVKEIIKYYIVNHKSDRSNAADVYITQLIKKIEIENPGTIRVKDDDVSLGFLLNPKLFNISLKDNWGSNWNELHEICSLSEINYIIIREKIIRRQPYLYPNYIKKALNDFSEIPEWLSPIYQHESKYGHKVTALKVKEITGE